MGKDFTRIKLDSETERILNDVKNDFKNKEEFLKDYKGKEIDVEDFKWRSSGNRHVSSDLVIRIALQQLDVSEIDDYVKS